METKGLCQTPNLQTVNVVCVVINESEVDTAKTTVLDGFVDDSNDNLAQLIVCVEHLPIESRCENMRI